MAERIFGARFAAERREPIWKQLGSNTSTGGAGKGATVTQVAEEAGIDYGVTTEPLFYQSPVTKRMVKTDRVAIVRPAFGKSKEAMLGVATGDYQPLQNHELFHLLDPLTQQWPVETLGALGNGETVFVTLAAGSAEVGGDEVRQYLLASNWHDGTTALKIAATPVRVVCMNTLIMGLEKASIRESVTHTRQILREAQLATQLVAEVRRTQDAAVTALRELVKITVPGAKMASILAAVYPEKAEPARLVRMERAKKSGNLLTDEEVAEALNMRIDVEQQRKRAIDLRLATLDRLEAFNDSRPKVANTAWAVYQAVTELENYRVGGNDQQAARSILFGERGNRMAIAYRELANINN